jgi:hypothetical protein
MKIELNWMQTLTRRNRLDHIRLWQHIRFHSITQWACFFRYYFTLNLNKLFRTKFVSFFVPTFYSLYLKCFEFRRQNNLIISLHHTFYTHKQIWNSSVVYLSNGSLRCAAKISQNTLKSCQTMSTPRSTICPPSQFRAIFIAQRKFKFNNMLCMPSDNIIISFWFIWAHQADLYIDFPMKFIHEKLTFLPHIFPRMIGLRAEVAKKLNWVSKKT